MSLPSFSVVTMQERPDLIPIADNVLDLVWPDIIMHLSEAVANQYWWHIWRTFPEYQFVLLEPGDETILAVGNSLPLAWDGGDLPDRGWDWALSQGFDDQAAGRPPAALAALAITIPHEFQGQGLSAHALTAMKRIGSAHGLRSLIAPLRPTLKSRYPLTPIERYLRWQRPDGQPFDPWIRVHARQGADIVGACPESMTITGTVEQWEARTQMQFPESGDYVVPHALVPVTINRDANQGTYVEPNVWACHTLR